MYVVFCNQNQRKVSTLEQDIDVKERERTRLLTEKGRLEQEAEVGFFALIFCVCVYFEICQICHLLHRNLIIIMHEIY